MDILLAKTRLNEETTKSTLKDLESALEAAKASKSASYKVFYLDRSMEKHLDKIAEHLGKKGYKVFPSEMKYGLDEGEHIYEVLVVLGF